MPDIWRFRTLNAIVRVPLRMFQSVPPSHGAVEEIQLQVRDDVDSPKNMKKLQIWLAGRLLSLPPTQIEHI